VDFGYGFIGSKDMQTRLAVRCVRNDAFPSGTPDQRYQDHDGGVLDVRTGLAWGAAVGGTYNWQGALDYCAGLGGGYRAPTFKELETLLDPTKAGLLTPKQIPADIVPAWSSTSDMFDLNKAWLVDFESGASGTVLKGSSGLFHARCVRTVAP
jgi:hypothetical protein